jgi:hypothetical protein
MNKVGRLVRSEEATNIINFNLLKNLSATFTIDDKEYTLDAGALGDFDGSL